jgi:hypothetical protein
MAKGTRPQHGRGEGGRSAWLLPVAVGAGVVAVGGIAVGVFLNRPAPAPASAPQPTVVVTTVVAPGPPPTVHPSARATVTALTAVLPASVLQYAYASSQPTTDWQAAGTLEAWTDTYTDGGTGTLTVQAGQFPTADQATAFAASLVAALPTAAPTPAATDAPALPKSGQVAGGGTVTGSYTIVDGGNGTGVAVWTNGTTVFRMVAPLGDILNAYAAYPL